MSAIWTADFLSRWTNQEYIALEVKRRDDIASNKIGNARNWDQVIAGDVVDTEKTKVQNLKADLVADGILSQERADAIFS